MSNQRNLGFWGGLLFGGALGTAVGLSLSPRSGRVVRQVLRQAATFSGVLQSRVVQLSAGALHNWDGTLERLQDSVSAGLVAGRQELDGIPLGKPQPSPPGIGTGAGSDTPPSREG